MAQAQLLRMLAYPAVEFAADALDAYFSPSWTLFQPDGGRDFSVIVDGISV